MSMAAALDLGGFIRQQLEDIEFPATTYDYGTVTASADGVVAVRGITKCRYGELIAFENDAFGIVLHLDNNVVRAAMLNGEPAVGSFCRGTGRAMQVPVGDHLIGRVVDAAGRALIGETAKGKGLRPIEAEAPGIMMRSKVDRALETGILALDAMIPIGRGQRELIIGDRQTGKTTIATDVILNQRGKGVVCVYCAIGQKASTVAQIVELFERTGAMDYTIVVASTASDTAAMQYIAPYAACAIAEEFMYSGRDALVVYDDLSKHAVAYRTLSLLLKRPPGREAYPGDVFYLHSRLLERSAQLDKAHGGGSLTALPIIETMSGDISAYIPTNVISITDGQIYLESDLFRSGVRPAVNVGLSVSRVGRSAQRPAVRSLAGTLRLELAQYRELAVFAQFGSDLDSATKKQLDTGVRLVELLKQVKQRPYALSEEAALLLAFQNGIFQQTDTADMDDFIGALLNFLHTGYAQQMQLVDQRGTLEKPVESMLLAGMKEFVTDWLADKTPPEGVASVSHS